MNLKIVIIIILLTAKLKQTLTINCGTTTSRQDGNTATITFTPDSIFKETSRTWIHALDQYHSPVVVFDNRRTVSGTTRYIEEFSDGRYVLKIHNVTVNDSGLYSVLCFTDRFRTVYSESTDLQITRDKPATYVTIQDLSTTSPTNVTLWPFDVYTKYSKIIGNGGSVDRKTVYETAEVENKTLGQPIDETTQTKNTQKYDDGSSYENKENHSTKDKTMIIGIVIGITVGIVATLAVVLVILLICKHRSSPNSVDITNTENHTIEDTNIASTRNESSDANLGYITLLPTLRTDNEREYADLMTSQPDRDYENP